MTRHFLWVTVCLFLGAFFPTPITPAPPSGGVPVDGVLAPPTAEIPELTEHQARDLEGLSEDPSLAPWQREFVHELVGRGASRSAAAGQSRPHGASMTDGDWSLGTPPSARRNHTAIYDPIRDRMVVCGGLSGSSPAYRNDVWALSLGGSPAWTEITPTGTPPSGRRSHTAIYDPVRDRMVVSGGFSSIAPTYRNDVWALSLVGTPMWTELIPTGTPPSARAEHSTIYDPVRDRVVLFGGTDGTYRNDVWELSLEASPAWTELTPTGTPPSARSEHTAIYDPVQDRMVVYGEWDDLTAVIIDVRTLSLAGSPAWTEIPQSGILPNGRWGHTAVYDAVETRMVIFGGYSNLGNDVWAFSLGASQAWTELPPLGTAPAGRTFHPAIYDPIRDRMVVTGGYPMYGHDAWALSLGGSPAWTRITPTGTPPSGRKNHSGIYDPIRDRMVIFGGYENYPDDIGLFLYRNDVWALSFGPNPTWTELTPTGTPPSERDVVTAIYDPVRDRMVIFGGHDGSYVYNDVWALSLGDNPAWTQLAPTGTPPVGRRRHAGIYDPVRDRLVVFGGYDSPGNYNCLNDAWALSLAGTPAWTQIVPIGTPPSGRGRLTAVYDSVQDRMILFGGWDCAFHRLNDAWALSLGGTPTWTQLAPAGTLPSGRSGHSAIYDPVRDRMVMFGGLAQNHMNDVWGLTWGTGSCAIPEIVSYGPSLVNSANCAGGCTVSFVVDTQDDYSGVTKITLERYLEGMWVPEDSVLAPLPAPTWLVACDIDQHYTDGEHVFHVVFHCADGSKGVSETATVIADRGVPVAIQRFEAEYSGEGIVLHWSVGEGAGFQGFNIYKSPRGENGFERINPALILPDEGRDYYDPKVSPGKTYWYRLGAIDFEGEWMSQTVSVTVPGALLALHQNVPNPFNPTTSISFVLPERSPVTLAVYDVGGRHVKTLLDAAVEGGIREAVWDGTDERGNRVSSGIYFYRLRVGERTLVKRMLLLK